MFGFVSRLKDRIALARVVDSYERAPDSRPWGTGTLRMAVGRLREPADPKAVAMSPTEILALISLIIQLIPVMKGVIEDIVAAIRARHAQQQEAA